MSCNPSSVSKQLVVATAFALGASSAALADDSSMNPFIGDSYKYFNGGHNLGDRGQPVFSYAAADPKWRAGHPNGLTERDLQALSSSGLSASAEQLNPPIFASVAAPLWRQSNPNGPTERELQAMSSSTLAVWQNSNGSESTASAATDQARIAQTPSKETLSARLARFLRLESGTQASTN